MNPVKLDFGSFSLLADGDSLSVAEGVYTGGTLFDGKRFLVTEPGIEPAVPMSTVRIHSILKIKAEPRASVKAPPLVEVEPFEGFNGLCDRAQRICLALLDLSLASMRQKHFDDWCTKTNRVTFKISAIFSDLKNRESLRRVRRILWNKNCEVGFKKNVKLRPRSGQDVISYDRRKSNVNMTY
ncbi:MAG: hypothetical protein L6Q38_03330 [Nitrospira sp.]|nr:hypothetical protein [Nitrospira sp.]